MSYFLWGMMTGVCFTLLGITLTSWFTQRDYRRAYGMALQAACVLLCLFIFAEAVRVGVLLP